jgi:hypothetical protein
MAPQIIPALDAFGRFLQFLVLKTRVLEIPIARNIHMSGDE